MIAMAFPSYKIAKSTDQETWDAYATHPLQSWAWGEFRKATGIDVVRVLSQSNKKTHCWQLTFHSIPHTPFTIGYFPKGPEPSEEMCQILKKIGEQKNAIFIQIEPRVEKKSELDMNSLKLISSHRPLFTKYTFVLDLTKSEDELFNAMHVKTRYNIRLATRHEVSIQEDSSPKAFEDYLRLTKETTTRQNFLAHDEAYHRHMWKILHPAGIARLWTATHKNETLAAWILFSWHQTLYYPYGASSRLHREVMAPNLLLWEIMRWGKRNNYIAFDLWGALGPNPNPRDPWYGFHRFKEGYSPKLVEFFGSYDLVVRPFLYRIFTLGNSLRWKLLHLWT